MRLLRTACLIILLGLVIFPHNAYTQETSATDQRWGSLGTVHWIIQGISRDWALRNAAGISKEQDWKSEQDYINWLNRITQNLTNQRVIQYVSIVPDHRINASTGERSVNLFIFVRDSWNIIVLPKPQYDPNTGLELSLRARDYNFLGTLQPLRINFGYSLDESYLNQGNFLAGALFVEIDSTTPLRLGGFDWTLDFDHLFQVNTDQIFQYRNITGLSMKIPLSTSVLTVAAEQGFNLNERNDDQYSPPLGTYFWGWYYTTKLRAALDIPTLLALEVLGKLEYTPSFDVVFNYRPDMDIGEQRRGPEIHLNQNLSLGQIDWIENFRQGLSMLLENENDYNVAEHNWDFTFRFSLVGHYRPLSFLGLSGRATIFHVVDGMDDAAARYVRGVLDNSKVAQTAAYLNIDLPLKLLAFRPGKWFGISWMHLFEFEQQWAPFLDVGVLYNPLVPGDTYDALICAGLEVITFPTALRSFFLRISLGFNLEDVSQFEPYIGIGHYY